ncbi:MAG: reactive intermediate/imine deaminase [Candidatus Adiutrix intracellularis]|jgi:2-iminobutanoate/2-iminopropanoate deaminase|nr:MAG: reactive intermediate/imine deaminase [Candidatus Adiutrix intracellularis]MDR2827291.1 RidA family protein [Candidatus Adiutrix intracellularis]
MKEVVSTAAAPAAVGPYSQAVKSGNTVYISGQLPLNPVTGQMPEAIPEQTHQSLTNIQSILKAAGTSLDKTLRVGIFMTDLAEFKAVNEVYLTFFTGVYPARSTVQVAALPLGAKIEIEAIAEL